MADDNLPYGMREQTSRVDRFCDACGQVDSDPHHVVGQADGTTQSRHMDCCKAAGCPDGTCDAVEDANTEGLRGAAFVEHIAGGGADHVNYAQEA